MLHVNYCYQRTYSVVFIKTINLLRLPRRCLTEKFIIFSVAVTGRFLLKKLFLKISQYSQESCRPATLLKRDTGPFLWI